jgi:hypothetical protein
MDNQFFERPILNSPYEYQDGTDISKSMDHGVDVCEDLWDAIFDACVAAVSL